MINRTLTLLALALFTACSSPIKQADKLMESGNFQEAIAVLDKAILSSPGDTKLLAKLGEARTKYVQRKFIEVRLARMAGNYEGALDSLSAALEQREKWSGSVAKQAGAVQVTIEEESEYARPVLKRRLEKLAESPLPWPILKERRQHRILYSELSPEWRKRLELSEKKKAKEQCKTLGLSKSGETPVYDRWIDQLCAPWSVPANPSQPIARQALNWKGTFGTISFKYSDGSAPKFPASISSRGLSGELSNVAQAAFQSSSWMEAASPDLLVIESQGGFSESGSQRSVSRKARYTQPKTIEVRDPSGNVRRETQQENFEYQYPVEIIERNFDIEANLSSSPGGRNIAMRFRQQKFQQDETHQTRDSRAGIEPDPLKLIEAGSWLNEQISSVQQQWSQKLEEGWVDAYCSGNSPFDLSTEECLARCFRSEMGRRRESPSLSQFTQERFGLPPQKLADVLGAR